MIETKIIRAALRFLYINEDIELVPLFVCIKDELEKIPNFEREVILQRYNLDLPVNDIANYFGISEEKVDNICSYYVRRMVKNIEKD